MPTNPRRFVAGDRIRYIGVATAYKNKTGQVLGYRQIDGLDEDMCAIIIPGFKDHFLCVEADLQAME